MVRVVVDTNVLVSALISKKPSYPLQIYNFLKSKDFMLVVSPDILEEYGEVFNRSEIVNLHRRTQRQIQTILDEIAQTSYIVPGLTKIKLIKDDPDDDKFIVAALEGSAEYIVSGDSHLLDVGRFESIEILSPKDFVVKMK